MMLKAAIYLSSRLSDRANCSLWVRFPVRCSRLAHKEGSSNLPLSTSHT